MGRKGRNMDKRKKKELIVKICCLIASFCLWFYINSNIDPVKKHTLKNIKVQITNTEALKQDGLAELPGQDYTISVEIEGPATVVYRASSDKIKAVADISKYALKKGTNRIPVEISENKTGASILNTQNLWVNVMLDKLEEKSVDIKTNINVKTEKGYSALSPECSASYVIVSGAEKFVDQVNEVKAIGDVTVYKNNVTLSLPLKAVDKNEKIINDVTISPSCIKVTIPVRKIKKVKVNVETKGSVSGGNLKQIYSSPNEIEIIGDDKTIDSINSINTDSVDLSAVSDNKTVSANLDIPSGVSVLNDIKSVNVTINMEKIVQKNINLNIATQNLQNGYSASLDQSSASLTVSGLESVISNIDASKIQCFVDLSSYTDSATPQSVPVKVVLPDGATQVSLDPANVKVTITKNK